MHEILALNFMQNALIGALLVSIAAGVIGTLVVINRMTFIAGGVAHGAYGGVGIAVLMGISPLLGGSIFAVALALIVAALTLRQRERFDVVIGAIWAFGMATGIIALDFAHGYTGDISGYLFGSILAITPASLALLVGFDVLVIAIVAALYPQICAVSFDSEFARLQGIRANAIYYLIVVLMAICVMLSIQIIGLLLVIALLTIPVYLAGLLCRSVASLMVLSALFSAIFCVAGLLLSYRFDLTAGACIIAVASVAFFGAVIVKEIKLWK